MREQNRQDEGILERTSRPKTSEPAGYGDEIRVRVQHVGDMPVLVSIPDALAFGSASSFDKNWLWRGRGETGRIYREQIRYSYQESRGWSEIGKAPWDMRMWDDDGSWFQAPSIRGIADIGMTVAVGLLTAGTGFPGMILNAGLNLLDDLAFTAMDVGAGYQEAGTAWGNLGKKALSAAASTVIGGAFGGWTSNASGVGGLDGWTKMAMNATGGNPLLGGLVQMGMGAAQGFVTNAATSAINAFGPDGWDNDAFMNGVFGKSAMIGYLTGGAKDLTRGFLGGYSYGYIDKLGMDASTLNNLAGGLVGAGLEYGLTGQTTINAFNLDIFGQEKLSGGLLEFTFGKDGVTSRIGMGGLDVSFNKLAGAVRGMEAWRRNAEIGAAGHAGSIIAMRALSSSQDPKIRAMYDSIMDGNLDLLTNSKLGASAQTTIGKDGRRKVTLGNSADGFDLAVLLGHEAYRNGLSDGAEGQRQETFHAVLGHIGIANSIAQMYGSSGFGSGLMGDTLRKEVAMFQEASFKKDFSAFGEYVDANYDSSADYWLKKIDGSLIDDGSSALNEEYFDVNGTKRTRAVFNPGTGRSAGLTEILGRERVSELLERTGGRNLESFDERTLLLAGGLSPTEVNALKGGTMTVSQRFALENRLANNWDQVLGQELMHRNGMAWNAEANTWQGGENAKFTFTDTTLRDGSLIVRKVGDTVERFTVTMTLTRDPQAYLTWVDGEANSSYQIMAERTHISWTKSALPGQRLANGRTSETYAPDFNFQSVARVPGYGGTTTKWYTPTGIDFLQAGFWEFRGNTIQWYTPTGIDDFLQAGFREFRGNTVVSDFDLRWHPDTQFGTATVGVIANATTLDGTKTGPDGRTAPGTARWLFHPFYWKPENSSGAILGSAGCVGPTGAQNTNWNLNQSTGQYQPDSGRWRMQQIESQMSEWGVGYGYVIRSYVRSGRVR